MNSFYFYKMKFISILLAAALILSYWLPPLNSAFAAAPSSQPTLNLTIKEKEFISRSSPLQASALQGVAPLMYVDKEGDVQGIAKLVLDEIAAATGLRFEIQAFNSISEFAASVDIGGILLAAEAAYKDNYSDLLFSEPFLRTQTILFVHKSIDPLQLQGKRLALIRGGQIPEGVDKNHVFYAKSREDALTAVNNGDADYGYGNVHSITYYSLQNHYQDLLPIPLEHETREYCIGIKPGADGDILLSIINKAIAGIDAERIQTLVLMATMDVEQRLTLSMIMDAYKVYIILAVAIFIFVLLLWFRSRLLARAAIEMQNQRYEILADLSNEFFFEYDLFSNAITFSALSYSYFDNECVDLITKAISAKFSKVVAPHHKGEGCFTVNCKRGIFRVVASSVHDGLGRLQTIIGKLVDISEEAAEKESLISRAYYDGLTGLFNAATVREIVEEHLSEKSTSTRDVLILIDANHFKDVNDTLGHYEGDQALKRLANLFKNTFREGDIVGRLGGDEFLAYVKNIPSLDFVENKCQQLVDTVRLTIAGIEVSICVGATIVEQSSYDQIFRAADAALYRAKAKGPAQVVVAGPVMTAG